MCDKALITIICGNNYYTLYNEENSSPSKLGNFLGMLLKTQLYENWGEKLSKRIVSDEFQGNIVGVLFEKDDIYHDICKTFFPNLLAGIILDYDEAPDIYDPVEWAYQIDIDTNTFNVYRREIDQVYKIDKFPRGDWVSFIN